jgi:hypothetical protein
MPTLPQNKVYLRKGPMKKHLLSGKSIAKNRLSNTLEEIKSSMPVMQALGLASNVRDIKINRLEQLQQMDDKSPAIALYCSLLRGSATKTKLRKSARFTCEQKAFMENCFEPLIWVKLRRKIDTQPSLVSNKMEERLGKEMGLAEQQIKSYWSAYKRKKCKR